MRIYKIDIPTAEIRLPERFKEKEYTVIYTTKKAILVPKKFIQSKYYEMFLSFILDEDETIKTVENLIAKNGFVKLKNLEEITKEQQELCLEENKHYITIWYNSNEFYNSIKDLYKFLTTIKAINN